MDEAHEIILAFINDAISPKFKITSNGSGLKNYKLYSWWDISPVETNSVWLPALISFRRDSGLLIVAAGYSSEKRSVIPIADPNAAKKILEAVQGGWDSCPDHNSYKR